MQDLAVKSKRALFLLICQQLFITVLQFLTVILLALILLALFALVISLNPELEDQRKTLVLPMLRWMARTSMARKVSALGNDEDQPAISLT
jgi:hypothetical protein